jgi:hypothetical protein
MQGHCGYSGIKGSTKPSYLILLRPLLPVAAVVCQ